jgi:hypothetical protein
MPSPFPGIDPYLEGQGYWPDFHLTFINYCREAVADQLPEHYEARLDERVSLVQLAVDEAKVVRPDLAIVQRAAPSTAPWQAPQVGALTLEPVSVPIATLEEVREAYIEILHRPDRTLVAVLELLSPGNKAEPGYGDYLVKRHAILRQPIHLVELDFLIGGRRLPMRRPLPPGDSYALVARADRRPECDVYAWTVRHPLPMIRVPLRAPDPDLYLDLAAVYATAYERGRYARSIDYAAPLTVPLAPEDRAWAEQRAARDQ